ncbi:MAG: S-adenosylmethionine:tRNA ribosyltransferase-isomerase [Sphingobacteriales bacterium]|nr:S-adenosylmethionine:tRNA ribosyltransferase-isomerase [Sphingobacteriales bacterium]
MSTNPHDLDIKAFDYHLPDERIARYPLEKRSKSALLVYRNGAIGHRIFDQIGTELPADCLLVMNETRVMNARLEFFTDSGARIELFCLEPAAGVLPTEALQSEREVEWTVMVGNKKRWSQQVLSRDLPQSMGGGRLCVERVSDMGRESRVRFFWDTPGVRFAEVLEAAGELPLPPYLKRKADAEDASRYNTVYARISGSVAAPTAGLHFSPELLEELRGKGCSTLNVRLHVGAGTFMPVSASRLEEHDMHSERIDVDIDSIRALASQACKGKILAVGTTSMRTLESLYWYGLRCMLGAPERGDLLVDQWDPYQPHDRELPAASAVLEFLANHLHAHGKSSLMGRTRLLIAPGYDFKLVDLLLTNFHQPGSTLLLLVAAFIGEDWRRCYSYALEHQFRFLSFGDASLLVRTQQANAG